MVFLLQNFLFTVSPQLRGCLAESHEFSEVESETSSGSQSENWDPQASSISSAESER